MKGILFLVLIAHAAFAQEPCGDAFPLKDGSIYYEKIIITDSAVNLFLQTKLWAVQAFEGQKSVLQVEDKEAGILVYKAFFPVSLVAPGSGGIRVNYNYWFNLTARVRENKLRVVIDNVNLKDDYGGGGSDLLTMRAKMESIRGVGNKKTKEAIYERMADNCRSANIKFESVLCGLNEYILKGESF